MASIRSTISTGNVQILRSGRIGNTRGGSRGLGTGVLGPQGGLSFDFTDGWRVQMIPEKGDRVQLLGTIKHVGLDYIKVKLDAGGSVIVEQKDLSEHWNPPQGLPSGISIGHVQMFWEGNILAFSDEYEAQKVFDHLNEIHRAWEKEHGRGKSFNVEAIKRAFKARD